MTLFRVRIGKSRRATRGIPITYTLLVVFLVIAYTGCPSAPFPAITQEAPERPREVLPEEERVVPEASLPEALPDPTPERVTPVLPAPAGPTPDPDLVVELKSFLQRSSARDGTVYLELPEEYPREALTVVARYAEPLVSDGVVLTLRTERDFRGTAFYGRVSMTVSAPTPYREYVQDAVVRGPMSFSGISPVDAELISLYSFPKTTLQRAVRRVRYELSLVVEERGIPMKIVMDSDMSSEERALLKTILRSTAYPEEDRHNPGERVWWLHRTPEALERYFRNTTGTFLPHREPVLFVDESEWTIVILLEDR